MRRFAWFKNVKNTHGKVLLLVKVQTEKWHRCKNIHHTNLVLLTDFGPLFHPYILWKSLETFSLLMFLGCIEMKHGINSFQSNVSFLCTLKTLTNLCFSQHFHITG